MSQKRSKERKCTRTSYYNEITGKEQGGPTRLDSKIIWLENWEWPLSEISKKNCLLIFDRCFFLDTSSSSTNVNSTRELRKFINTFPYKYEVEAGENLKELHFFSQHMNNILSLLPPGLSRQQIFIVALGGGSVGDFCGFVASILKRGTQLILIPSTWLSAMDSAHGGKTALNIGVNKNQIGTFYPAQQIIIYKRILYLQPPERLYEALGELLKTSLLKGGSLWTLMRKSEFLSSMGLWELLPILVKYKNQIVSKDPFEEKGVRLWLNLGHTVGHALEIALNIPHGVAVHLGLRFAIEFSLKQNILSKKEYQKINECPFLLSKEALSSIIRHNEVLQKKKPIEDSKNDYNLKALSKIIETDKKVKDHKLAFVFIKKPGRPIVKKTEIKEIIGCLDEILKETRFYYNGIISSSKSLMNRGLVAHSYFSQMKLEGDSQCQDVQAMKIAIQSIQKFKKKGPNEGLEKKKDAVFKIQCHDAGTVLRFLAVLVSKLKGTFCLYGTKRLFQRPQISLIKLLKQLGVQKAELFSDHLKIESSGWPLSSLNLIIPFEQSSQFASGVILNSWNHPYEIKIQLQSQKELISQEYLEMTIKMMQSFGMTINFNREKKLIVIPENQTISSQFRSKNSHFFLIEPDMSSAFALAVAASLMGELQVHEFPQKSLQPDAIFIEILKRIGVFVECKKPLKKNGNFTLFVSSEKIESNYKPLEQDMRSCPDLFPLLSVLLAFVNGKSVLFGAPQLAFKESHRIKKTYELLSLIQVKSKMRHDGIEIMGKPLSYLNFYSVVKNNKRVSENDGIIPIGVEFDPDHDHRMAMAAGILQRLGIPLKIKTPQVVSKSFPEFWEILL